MEVRNCKYKIVKYSSNSLFSIEENINNLFGIKKIKFLITLIESGFNLIKMLHEYKIIHNYINLQSILITKKDFFILSNFSFSFLTNEPIDINCIIKGLVPLYYREILLLDTGTGIFNETHLNKVLDSLTSYFKNTYILEEEELIKCINNYKLFLKVYLNIEQKQIISDFNNLLFSWDIISFSFTILTILKNYNYSEPLINIRKFFVDLLSPPWNKPIHLLVDQFKDIYLNASSSSWESLIKINM